MRRMTGAILIEIRPEMISRSAWRGEARNASKPKRAMSTREPTMAIISIAQQARPKVAGMNALPRAQLAAFSSVVVSTRSSTYCSSSASSSSPRIIACELSWRERNELGSDTFSRRTTSIPVLPVSIRR